MFPLKPGISGAQMHQYLSISVMLFDWLWFFLFSFFLSRNRSCCSYFLLTVIVAPIPGAPTRMPGFDVEERWRRAPDAAGGGGCHRVNEAAPPRHRCSGIRPRFSTSNLCRYVFPGEFGLQIMTPISLCGGGGCWGSERWWGETGGWEGG